MTRQFLRRWFKLKVRILTSHPLSLFLVTASAALVLSAFAWLPRNPRTSSSAVPTVNFLPQEPTPAPTISLPPPPSISALHSLVLDLDSDSLLYSKSADDSVAPASTTKLMTALVALENYPLNKIITIDRSFPEGQNIGLIPGEHLTVEQLLYALLIQSGNDAAEVLAENFPDGRPAFVTAMNQKAAGLLLFHTSFQNPTGLDEAGHVSTAADLARLARYVLKNPFLSRIVASENAVISYDQSRVLTNTNELLGRIPGVLGVKTGYTDAAGEALITLVNRDNKKLLFVVLKSTDRFADTETLINWAYQSP